MAPSMDARPSNGPVRGGREWGKGGMDGQRGEDRSRGQEMSAVAAGCRSRVTGFVVHSKLGKKRALCVPSHQKYGNKTLVIETLTPSIKSHIWLKAFDAFMR